MSQTQGETERIGEHEYTVFMLPPLVAIDLLVELSKMLGPGLGPVVDAIAGAAGGNKVKAVLDADIGADFFSRAATSLFGQLSKETVRDAIKTVRDVTHVDGKPLSGIFDIHFRGKLGDLSLWLAFALKVQYGNFWSAWASTLSNVPGIQVQTQSQSQSI